MCYVLHDGKLSEPIHPNAGVRQGCAMSPLLFLVVIDEILCNCIDEQLGRRIPWHPIKMEHLENLDLADDIAMLST